MPAEAPVVIYHRNCIDGYAGAVVAYQAGLIKTKSHMYPDIPSSKSVPRDIVKGKNVYIIDVAYPLAVVQEICKAAKKVVFIDHHLTTEAFIGNTSLPSNLKIVFDKSVCGSVNAWKHFFPKTSLPKALELINDNDTGQWKLPDTKAFTAGVELKMSYKPTVANLDAWKAMFASDAKVTELINEGQKFEEFRTLLANTNKTRMEIVKFPGPKLKFKKQYKVALINASCPSVTTLGNAIMDIQKPAFDFVAMWWYSFSNDTYNISLRSKSVNVNEIAKLFGGGGHELAAACSIPGTEYTIRDIFAANT